MQFQGLSVRARLAPLAVVAVCLSTATPTGRSQQQADQDWSKVFEGARSAVVVIETDQAQGSGFLIKPDGTLATNFHVIQGAKAITVKLSSGETYHKAFILATNQDDDIAILRIEGFGLPVIPLGDSNECKVGQAVALIGAPRGFEETVSSGIVSSIRLNDGIRVIQTSAPASPGSSGGPLLNARGEAVGILSFSRVESQNLNFAISINYLRAMLETLAVGTPAPTQTLESSRATSEVSKKPGIVVAGYGSPAEFFEFAYLEITNFLASRGVAIANEPSEFKQITGDEVSLNHLLDSVSESGAFGLLYLRVEHGWSNIHRVSIQCFSRDSRLLWEEKASSSTSWAGTEDGAAQAVLERIKKKLAPRIGGMGLPLKTDLLPKQAN